MYETLYTKCPLKIMTYFVFLYHCNSNITTMIIFINFFSSILVSIIEKFIHLDLKDCWLFFTWVFLQSLFFKQVYMKNWNSFQFPQTELSQIFMAFCCYFLILPCVLSHTRLSSKHIYFASQIVNIGIAIRTIWR